MNCKIIDMHWERIFLKIIYEADSEQPLVLYKVKTGPFIKLNSKKITKNTYEIAINMVAVKDRTFLENGRWKIGFLGIDKKTDLETAFNCVISNEMASKSEYLDKIFRYTDRLAYTVNFEVVSENDEIKHLFIHSRFMKNNKKWQKLNLFQESTSLRSFFKKLTLRSIRFGINVFYQIATRLYPKRGNRVLIMTESSEYLVGNLRTIYDKLLERKKEKNLKVEYSARNVIGKENSAWSWMMTTIRLAKSDCIIVDNYVPIFGFINLDKRVKLIQVWHAGVGFKSVGYSRFGRKGSPKPMQSCHKKYTHALVGSHSLIEVYEEVFGIEREAFLPIGLPRLDGYLDEKVISEFKKEFYETYPFLKNKKIILFAPTYRGTGQKTAFYDYSKLDFQKLYDFCGKEYVFLMKMHPFIKKKPRLKKYENRIIDFSFFPDINSLYYITDIHITDYSSSYYEFSLMRRPILFYTYDRILYETTRGVHHSVKEAAPGKVCDTFDELLEALKNKDFEIEKTLKFVDDNFSEYDGNSADKLIDVITDSKMTKKK